MPAPQVDLLDKSGRRTRSPLSRITSAFSTKPRNLTGFNIVLDEPHRKYAPGDAVNGQIELTVHKLTRITHIVLSLLGYVKVYKHPVVLGDGVPADVTAPSTGKGRRGTEYHGNGQALLFEEETIVCGEGRLTPGRYAFKFGIRFPSSGLPSSLDFERGTIAYSLVSTLTRPTTISPTVTHEHKIYLDELIDVAQAKPPKPDLITITPMLRRAKTKKHKKIETGDPKDPAGPSVVESREDGTQSEVTSSQEGSSNRPTRRNSGATSISSNNPSFERPRILHSCSNYDESLSAKSLNKGKTITARVELLRGGYLAGDLVPIRILIQHTKFVKSIPGVIVTLFRIGRIDRHPLLPVGTPLSMRASGKGLDPAQVGISGLSLSAADKSHSFRMELAQSMAPMIVNPNTLQAEIKTAVRIPEGTFPTIVGVPGRLISFTYHVEVIMDLHGKLFATEGIIPRMNMTNPESAFTLEANLGNPDYGAAGSTQAFLNTAQLRREKSIVHSTFDVVVGTKDSLRKAAKKQSDPWVMAQKALSEDSGASTHAPHAHDPEIVHTTQQRPQMPLNLPQPSAYDHTLPHQTPELPHPIPTVHDLIPPPPVEEPENEKERMRAMEERLLPSAPPVEYASRSHIAPSAPTLEDLEAARLSNALSTPPQPASAFAQDPGTGSSSRAPASGANDDKRELERQRLLAHTSSPYDEEGDHDLEGQVSHGVSPMPMASAPFFDEQGEYVPPSSSSLAIPVGSAPEDEHLPRYQK